MVQKNTKTPRRGHYVEANGLNMYYQESGSGTPLVLLHAGTVSSDMWHPFLPSFVPHFRVIMPDSRGHGKTNNPKHILSYALMADDIAAFIQALNLSRPLIFGYSDGGQVALEIGIRYPGLAGALVVGAAAYKLSGSSKEMFTALGFEKPGGVNIKKVQRDHPDLIALLKKEHARLGGPDYWKTLLKQYSLLWWTPLDYTAEDFHKITAPTLILQGDHDEFVKLEQALEMYRLIPNAELAILPGSRHSSPNVKLFANTVIDFFLRHLAAKNNELKHSD